MIYPTFVYKKSKFSPDQGRPYIFKQVWNDSERDALVKDGWFINKVDALSKKKDKPKQENPAKSNDVGNVGNVGIPESTEIPDDDAIPTRAELESKAIELGLKFDGRTKDASLLKRINEALEK